MLIVIISQCIHVSNNDTTLSIYTVLFVNYTTIKLEKKRKKRDLNNINRTVQDSPEKQPVVQISNNHDNACIPGMGRQSMYQIKKGTELRTQKCMDLDTKPGQGDGKQNVTH